MGALGADVVESVTEGIMFERFVTATSPCAPAEDSALYAISTKDPRTKMTVITDRALSPHASQERSRHRLACGWRRRWCAQSCAGIGS